MTPIDWLRFSTRTVPTPPPAPPVTEDLVARATVFRLIREDRDAACDQWPSLEEWRQGWPNTRQNLSEPSQLRSAPTWDGSSRGMCRWSR